MRIALLILALMLFTFAAATWEYKECRNAGYSRLYCALHIGKK